MKFGVDIPFVDLVGFHLELAFTEATVFDEAGQTCAHATGTFKYTHALANGEPGVAALPICPDR